MIRSALVLFALAACGAPAVSTTTPSSALAECRNGPVVRDGWYASSTERGELDRGRRVGIWKFVRGERVVTANYRESGAVELLDIAPSSGADPESERAHLPPPIVPSECPPTTP